MSRAVLQRYGAIFAGTESADGRTIWDGRALLRPQGDMVEVDLEMPGLPIISLHGEGARQLTDQGLHEFDADGTHTLRLFESSVRAREYLTLRRRAWDLSLERMDQELERLLQGGPSLPSAGIQ